MVASKFLISFFSSESCLWTALTLAQSATALSMLASAMAILSSYSFLYFPNWVHLRLGLMHIQIWSHFQVFASIKARRALWHEYNANF